VSAPGDEFELPWDDVAAERKIHPRVQITWFGNIHIFAFSSGDAFSLSVNEPKALVKQFLAAGTNPKDPRESLSVLFWLDRGRRRAAIGFQFPPCDARDYAGSNHRIYAEGGIPKKGILAPLEINSVIYERSSNVGNRNRQFPGIPIHTN